MRTAIAILALMAIVGFIAAVGLGIIYLSGPGVSASKGLGEIILILAIVSMPCAVIGFVMGRKH